MKTNAFKSKLKVLLGESGYDSLRLMYRLFKLSFNVEEEDSSTIQFHKKIIHQDDTIFDIGSNKGFYSYHYSKIAKNGFIYSFEPIISTYKLQLRLLRYFKVKNCKASNIALSNIDGEIEFIMPKSENYNSDTSATISTEGTLAHFKEKDIVKVQCEKINTFLLKEDIKKVDFVKIDVEGSELLVFEGADKLLSMHPIVFTEFLERHFVKFGYNCEDLVTLFKKYTYKVYFYSIKYDGLILDEHYTEESRSNCYFIPESRVNELITNKVIININK